MNADMTPLAGSDVSRETIEKLESLAALIAKWTKSINLIAPSSVPDIWNRHIVDSAQIFALAPKTWKNWVDIGSGGGLPALVIAVMDQEEQPMTLIESDKRKCLFLNTARRELSLNITVNNDRIENTDANVASVLSARALAPLPALINHAYRLLEPEGTALFSKGERFKDELEFAREDWDFECIEHQSHTNPGSRVLEISRIRHRES